MVSSIMNLASMVEFAYSLRMELGFLVIFAALWFATSIFGLTWETFRKVGPDNKKGFLLPQQRKGVRPALFSSSNHSASGSSPHADSSVVRRRGVLSQPAAFSVADSAASSAKTTLNFRNPTTSQLRDPAWVSVAIQQLCRTQVQKALELYREAVNAGLDLRRAPPVEGAQLFVALVTSAIRVGQADEALQLLRDCRHGPGITPALLASATKLCTSKQMFKECLAIYDFAREDPTLIVEDRSVWSCLLFCAVESQAYNLCSFFFARLKAFGSPSNKDFGNMIRCASTQGDWKLSLSLVQEMRAAEMEVDSVLYNTALATCVAANKTDQARALLEEMEEGTHSVADVITYNTLSKGYAKAGRMDQCFELFGHMRGRNIVPSQVTYGILLDCCINEKKMDRAAEVFDQMKSEGCVMNTVLYTTLIKGFARADQVDQAMKVYKQMCSDRDRGVSPDLITFSILIKANCDAGRLETALQLLESMIGQSLYPDEVVFNNLLGGCVRESNAELARKLYASMLEGNIKPSNATFSILIRLYAQCKLLDEAVETLRKEPEARGVEPEPRLYMQLAQACLRERQGRRAVEVYRLLLERAAPTAQMHSTLLGLCIKLNMLETGTEILELAAEVQGRVDVRDAMALREAAMRKRKTHSVDKIDAAVASLNLSST